MLCVTVGVEGVAEEVPEALDPFFDRLMLANAAKPIGFEVAEEEALGIESLGSRLNG